VQVLNYTHFNLSVLLRFYIFINFLVLKKVLMYLYIIYHYLLSGRAIPGERYETYVLRLYNQGKIHKSNYYVIIYFIFVNKKHLL